MQWSRSFLLEAFSLCMLLYIYVRKRVKAIVLNSPICWGMPVLSKALYWHHGQRLQFSKGNYLSQKVKYSISVLIWCFRKCQLF